MVHAIFNEGSVIACRVTPLYEGVVNLSDIIQSVLRIEGADVCACKAAHRCRPTRDRSVSPLPSGWTVDRQSHRSKHFAHGFEFVSGLRPLVIDGDRSIEPANQPTIMARHAVFAGFMYLGVGVIDVEQGAVRDVVNRPPLGVVYQNVSMRRVRIAHNRVELVSLGQSHGRTRNILPVLTDFLAEKRCCLIAGDLHLICGGLVFIGVHDRENILVTRIMYRREALTNIDHLWTSSTRSKLYYDSVRRMHSETVRSGVLTLNVKRRTIAEGAEIRSSVSEAGAATGLSGIKLRDPRRAGTSDPGEVVYNAVSPRTFLRPLTTSSRFK